MRRVLFTLFAIAVGGALGFFIALRTITVRGAAKPGTGFARHPGTGRRPGSVRRL